jgi:hypothetical protein
VVIITCTVVQVGLAAGQVMGLPVPSIFVGSINPLMDDGPKRSLQNAQLKWVQGLAKEAEKEMEPAATKALERLKVAKDHTVPLEPQAAEVEIEETRRISGSSYQALKAFIDEKDPQKQHFGLVKGAYNGYVEWVAPQNVETVEAWKRGCAVRAHQAMQGPDVGQAGAGASALVPPPGQATSAMETVQIQVPPGLGVGQMMQLVQAIGADSPDRGTPRCSGRPYHHHPSAFLGFTAPRCASCRCARVGAWAFRVDEDERGCIW